MSQELDRAQNRLENIRTVVPLLGALRTISLGSWQTALKQKTSAQRYGERLRAMLPLLLPHLPVSRQGRRESPTKQVVVLLIGSERGLCGRFNAALVEYAEDCLRDSERDGVRVELEVLGGRARRILEYRQVPLAWSGALPVTAIPSSRLAFDLTRRWLARYEAGELDAVDLVYNAYQGIGRHESTMVRLIPPQMPPQTTLREPWPPYIIETAPLSLYARIVEQWAAIRLYELLLDSMAAEHATRYQLMEAATQNADRLIEELTITVQMARRHAITREMQELAVGAGLLGSR